MKVLFFPWRPRVDASSRFRIYQYIKFLESVGIHTMICPPASDKIFVNLYKSGNFFKKGVYLFICFISRCYQVFFIAARYHVVYLQRELFSIGPPILERILKYMGKIIIYDFDDAIFLKPPYVKNKILVRLHMYQKTSKIVKYSRSTVVGNWFLHVYASRYCPNVTIIPTIPIIQPFIQNSVKQDNKIIVGWMGTAGNLIHLKTIEQALVTLSERIPHVEIRVISDTDYNPPTTLSIVNRTWRLEIENQELQSFDIGIMPLLDTTYSRGKCGFKILQYMAAGVPVVCSPVGVNQEIVQNGINGFWATDVDEWIEKLEYLIKNEDVRENFRKEGFRTIDSQYSFVTSANKLTSVIKSCQNI